MALFRPKILSLLSLCLILNGQSDGNYDNELVYSSNKFGYNLANEIFDDTSANLWISPFCITSCFSLIYPGAIGQTQSQIVDVMGYPSCSSSSQTDSQCTNINQPLFYLQTSVEDTYNGSRRHWSHGSIVTIANKIYINDTITAKQSYIDALYDISNSG